MKKLLLSLFTALSIAGIAKADKVTLSRAQAFELHDSFSSLQAGVSPANVFTAAEIINALDETARAYRAAAIKVERLRLIANLPGATPAQISEFLRAEVDFNAAAEERKTYELPLMALAQSEVDAAKITARQLAPIKRLLRADPKPAEAAK